MCSLGSNWQLVLIEVRAWCWTGDKPLSQAIISQFTDTYVPLGLNELRLFSLILESSFGLWVGIQSAGEWVPWVWILATLRKDNFSPFHLKSLPSALFQSKLNNKYFSQSIQWLLMSYHYWIHVLTKFSGTFSIVTQWFIRWILTLNCKQRYVSKTFLYCSLIVLTKIILSFLVYSCIFCT